MLDPVDQVVCVIRRIGTEPTRRSPSQTDKFDVGIAGFGLLHQPPLVATCVVLVGGGALVGGFGALGRVGVAADFNLENLQRSAIIGLEQIVQNLAALRFWVIDQQARSAAAAADRAHAVKLQPGARSVDRNGVGGRLNGQGRDQQGNDQEQTQENSQLVTKVIKRWYFHCFFLRVIKQIWLRDASAPPRLALVGRSAPNV